MHLIASNWILWLATPANWPIVLAVAGGLGFVIFVHELGHFLVAKACGVKCEKFYLGFDIYGLKICKFQWGETEYGIGILPLGGYVKMLGQDDNPGNRTEENRRAQVSSQQAAKVPIGASAGVGDHAPPLTHGDLPPEPVSDPHEPYDPRSYMAQSVPKRMAIISAGVIMNVIFAFIMATVAYALGVKETPCIVRAVSPGGAAWRADLQPGDVITRIGNVENPRFRDLVNGVTLGDADKGVEFEIHRPGSDKSFTVSLHPDKNLMVGIVGPADAVLRKKEPTVRHSPANRAEPKFESGDRIIKINDVPVKDELDVEREFALHPDVPLEITVERQPSTDENAQHAESAKAAAEAQQMTIKVEPTPVRDFGFVMTLDPISAVQPNSPAAAAGIKPGDRLLSVDGKPIENPLVFPDQMRRAALAGQKVKLGIERDVEGKATPMEIEVTPRVPQTSSEPLILSPLGVEALGIAIPVMPKVARVIPGSPGAEAKIEPGDELLGADVLAPEKPSEADKDEEETGRTDLSKDLSWPSLILDILPLTNPERKVRFWVKHGDQERQVDLLSVPLVDEHGLPLYTAQRGLIFEPLVSLHTAKSMGEAVRLGSEEALDNLLLVYRFLQRIGQGKLSLKMTAGPVGMAQMAGMKVQEGFAEFLIFLTMLSANLAVINFLPIPVLDGGHMVFLLYEGIRRKPASERVIVAFTYAGLIFLLSLMLFVFLLDVHIIPRR